MALESTQPLTEMSLGGLDLLYNRQDRRDRLPLGSGIETFVTESRTALACVQPRTKYVLWAVSSELKLSEHKGNHTCAAGSDVENAWGYTSTFT